MRLLRGVAAAVCFAVIVGLSVVLGAALAPGLPWWAWAFAVVFWALLWRRRRLRAAGLLDVDPAAAQWSPVRSARSDR